MASFNTSKVDGNTVSASEYNQLAEVNNFITNTGQTPSTANLQQMGIGASRYSSAGQYFEDTGIANAYVLNPTSPFKSPVSSTSGEGYFTGMQITFKTANANTGASTVNINGAGVKNLKKSDGTTDLSTGEIPANQYISFIYNGTSFVKQAQATATSTIQGISYLLPNRNIVINGNFSINQRVVSGTVSLSAGSYGHDRWKAGSSGCTYTFSTTNNITTLTITAGSLIQVIEGNNLISDTYCLSWSGTAQGKIGAGSYGATGITGSATGGTDLNIEFNTGTISLVQLEKNLAPTPFEHRFYNNELALCQRYYYKTFPQATVPAQNAGVDGAFLFGNPSTNAPGVFTPNLRFPVLMRTNPTITLYNPSATNAQIRNINNSSDFSGTASQNVSVYGLNFTGTSTGSQAQSCAIHITATAEI